MELPFYKIAKNLNVAISTAHRTCNNFEVEGDVVSKQQRCRSELRALDEHAELLVIGLISESPTLYLDEIVHKVSELTSIVVSPTICRLFKRYGFTRKANSSAEMLCSSWCIYGTVYFIIYKGISLCG